MDGLLKYLVSAKFIISLIIVAVALVIGILLKRIIKRITKSIDPEDSKKKAVWHNTNSAVRSVLILITVLIVLQVNDINVGSLIASLGIVSAVVGLALQDFFKDIIMGYHIMSDHFFSVGDVVLYEGVESVVKSFNAKSTKLESTVDHSVMTVCNRNISEITVVSDESDLDVPLPYGESAERVFPILQKICRKIGEIDGIDRCRLLGTYSFESSAICYKIRLCCPPKDKFFLRIAAMRVLQDGLLAAGIEIPFTQIDIHQK